MQKAHALISNYIRQQLDSLPEKICIQRTGFLKLHGQWIYVHDHAAPADNSIVFDTGRYIPCDRGTSQLQSFRNAMAFLDICERDELIIPLFLLAHLGPMFALFAEAGRIPRFVTILTGRSGSLKTSLSLARFRLFQDQGLTPLSSFRDTEAAIEIKLGMLNGSVGLFDDLRPPVSDQKSKDNIEKLESLIRAVGDYVPKSRSNPKLTKAKEFVPSGCALVTAEDLSGSQSSLLRCLILSINRGDISGEKLRRFQDDPTIVTTHMNHFLEWLGYNAEKFIHNLTNNYPGHQFEQFVGERRLVDTGTILSFTCDVLARYGHRIGAMNEEESMAFRVRCISAIIKAVNASEEMSKDANPCAMYLKALFDLIEKGEIRLATSIETYAPGFHTGFQSKDCAWFDPHEVYAKVRQYYSRINIVFPLSEAQLSVHLADAELIEITIETRNGTSKRLFTRKTSLPGRKRMQVLHLDRARAYLEELD